MPGTFTSLFVITVIAALSPILADIPRRFRAPAVVLEIAAGILVGPQVLGWADVDAVISFLSTMGLAFLFFLAGMEIDLERIRGRPLTLALTAWGISLACALVLGLAAAWTDLIISPLLFTLALTTTALGTLMPILRDSGDLDTRFGSYMLGAGTVGEFGPIIAISLFLTTEGTAASAALLSTFAVLAVLVGLVALRARPPRVVDLIERTMDSSGQLAIRLCVVIMVGLVWVADEFGLDSILGAFTAGLVVGLITRGASGERVRVKLDGVGYGVFVPVFFIVTGLQFDLDALTGDPAVALRVVYAFGLLLLLRGVPTYLLTRHDLSKEERLPLAFYTATGLPLIVAVTTIGVETGTMRPENAAALVSAGMLSVLVFPAVALALRKRAHAVDPTQAEPVAEM